MEPVKGDSQVADDSERLRGPARRAVSERYERAAVRTGQSSGRRSAAEFRRSAATIEPVLVSLSLSLSMDTSVSAATARGVTAVPPPAEELIIHGMGPAAEAQQTGAQQKGR
ncbi:hypothetical protein AB0M39_03885 [Streptomyces sp. NPDC051907]|uniref:hypothetical protein n=1 Tax=Streptomyces sp. NPDC051907 TaxID=3155284 RepID=UPI0034370510